MAKRAKKIREGRDYRRRQKSTSIYFLLWAAFTALSLIIVLLLGFSQSFVMEQTYKHEAAQDVTEKGRQIERRVIEGAPEAFGGNNSAYIRYLAVYYDVRVFILSPDGALLYPQEPQTPDGEKLFDFSQTLARMQEEMQKQERKAVVYEGEDEYVYGSKISLYGRDAYLYVEKSLNLIVETSKQMDVRMLLVSVFIFVLSFAISSGVSGWLTKPISEMTDKAKQLARGDFTVDFHGTDYGKEMVELADTLNYARDEISKADAMQKELIANVSHDFKTPLTMIKAYASMIMEISGDIPEKRNKHAQVIVDEADRLASLVGDVLELSKMRSGLETLKSSEFDMSSYLHEILSRFDYLKDTKGYLFVLEVEENLWTRGDELKLGQVVYNLIGNAVNYTGEDKKVFVRLKKLNDTAFRFSVTDTGAGIKEEDLPTIWARYYRSSETHKRPVQGTGLGLSIVKTVLEKHRFVFGVESERGKGSTFYVDFPLVSK